MSGRGATHDAESEVGLEQSSVDLYWLPLGAGKGGGCVRTSGHLYEALIAGRRRRAPLDLYHSALVVHLDGVPFTIEMTPVWAVAAYDRGVSAKARSAGRC